MANISALHKPARKGEPPKPTETVQNLAKPPAGNTVALQVRMSPEMRRDFKTWALAHDLDAKDLFAEVWSFYKDKHG